MGRIGNILMTDMVMAILPAAPITEGLHVVHDKCPANAQRSLGIKARPYGLGFQIPVTGD
jgi:hypothetical protein